MVSSWILALFASLAGVSGTVGATTLTEKQLAAHDHAVIGRSGGGGGDLSLDRNARVEADGATKNAGSSASHTHSLTGVKSGPASSLPPYYALAYIMRVA